MPVQTETKAREAVDEIFTNLRDRRFLKWLFDRNGNENLIGRFDNGEELRGLDLEVQEDIKSSWANIIANTFDAPQSGLLAEAVKVKPLEWEGDFAHTTFGLFYYIEHATGVPGYVVLEKHAGSSTTKSGWETIAEAKAAAQADYEQRIRSALAAPAQPESRAVPVGGFVAGARVRVKDTGETGEIIRCPMIVQADEDDGTQAAMGGTKWIGEFDPSQLELLPLPAAPAQPVEAQTQEKVVVTPEIAARVLYENWSGLDSLPSPARELASQGHFFSALRLLFEPDADLTRPPKAASSLDDIHTDDLAVERFAAAMKAKLATKRDEGRSGWEDKDECSQLFLSQLLREHVEKGDPVDVGNLAMMLHQRDERISSLLETLQGE